MADSSSYGPFHGHRLAEFAKIAHDPTRLTEAQLDGRACLFCGLELGAMIPIGIILGTRVWSHEACPEGSADGK